MRALGIDVGRRRVGLAISDASRTLARPLETVAVNGSREAVELVGRAIDRLSAEEDGLDTIVVGMPAHLDGTPTTETAYACSFVEALRLRTKIAIVTEGEQLTSHEADRRLAVRERDWRKRKAKLDAAAAAIILQDYLDRG
jgi:putative Holliday junction resolvase